MWDSGRTPHRVVEHGVVIPDGDFYTGELERGITVVNNLVPRGRRLGADIFEQARSQVPLDLVGMGAAEAGGLGEIPLQDLPAFEGRYRFFFNPIRYTSLGLAVCEAMMAGMPIVGMATTEMPTVIQKGLTGYVETSVPAVIERMRELLGDRDAARRMGQAARQYARDRFGIERFVRDWGEAFEQAIALRQSRPMEAAGQAAAR
jgi:glycosyltransferase involved in cell wall biosynthesis